MNQIDINIQNLKEEISVLKCTLREKENLLSKLESEKNISNPYCDNFTPDEVSRYSRQMIIPEIKVEGQLKLKRSNVLIVGAGGLGCPAALYLAAAGVGNITIVDNDVVELSNLHRQILHNESSIGVAKVESAKIALNSLNKNVNITPLEMHLNNTNISNLIKGFNVIIDGTDNVTTRYLLNDACVLQKKALVSGSALKFEGQLTVYNYHGGPCYRCLYPVPPLPDTVTSCGDAGVVGAVPGCIGVLQALETIKILLDMPDVLAGRLLIFDGESCTFRNVILRGKKANCNICGIKPIIKEITNSTDYELFCNGKAHDKGESVQLLSKENRTTVQEFNEIVQNKLPYFLLDVRPETEYEMCRLPNSTNIPFTDIQRNLHYSIKEKLQLPEKENLTVYVLCRRGNDSQKAVRLLQNLYKSSTLKFKDIIGGLHAFSAKIDSRFPIY